MDLAEAARKAVTDAENMLHKAHEDHVAPGQSKLAEEFYELRIQAAVFQYDISKEVFGLVSLSPNGLAEKIVLKDIVHKLFEYESALSSRITKRIIELGKSRGIDGLNESIREEKNAIKPALAKLRGWSDVRNQSSGHYGADIKRQVSLLSGLDRREVENVAHAFLAFNLHISKLLRTVGRGGHA